MPKINDIPKFTHATYSVDIFWSGLPEWYLTQVREYGLNVLPDFQRKHKWTPTQKSRYVEFILRGGTTGKDIYTNHPAWSTSIDLSKGPYVLVDGKHRLDAVFGFLNDEVPAFGHLYSEYEDRDRMRIHCGFKWHVNELQTRDEVLQWYADLNAAGTPHTEEEIGWVQALLGTPEEPPPTEEERHANARLDRALFKRAEEESARRKNVPIKNKRG